MSDKWHRYSRQIIAGVIILVTAVATGTILSLVISFIFKDFIWQFLNLALLNSFILGIGMMLSAYFVNDLIFKTKNITLVGLSFLLISGAGIASLLFNFFHEPTIFLYYYNGVFSYLLINFLFILVLNTIIVGFLIYHETVTAKDIALNEEKILKQDIELKLLLSKLNPHFLFNSLNMIVSLLKKPSAAEDALLNLTDLLRYSLDHSDTDRVLLKRELENVEKYLSIQKMRYEERLAYDIDLSAELADHPIPPMIVQPLVENAILHNIDRVEALQIHVTVNQGEKGIIIQVVDSERRIEPRMVGTGTGLIATKKRIEYAGGRFDIKDGGIEISFDYD